MTSRLLIVPAAGLGTRLGADRPKLLVPVAGKPMIDRLLALFADVVDRAVVIVHPSFERLVGAHLATSPLPVATLVQVQPTGMLDAIVMAKTEADRTMPDEVLIVWCDQVAIHPDTIRRLVETTSRHPRAAAVLPTVRRESPYIHLQRDVSGRIEKVLHRREGDAMPPIGESDMGLFALPGGSFGTLLPAYAADVSIGAATGERNFLPFLAWAARRHDVVTFPSVDDMEAVGVNTPADLRRVEDYLQKRENKRA